jgi:hypothetical protein
MARGSSAVRRTAPPSGVEQPADEDEAILGGVELEHPVLDAASLLSGVSLGVAGVAGIEADMAEAADGELGGAGQECALVEGLSGGRLMKGVGGAGHQGEMGKADAAVLQGLNAQRQPLDLFAHADPLGGGVARHPALVADPADGTDRPLDVVFVSGGKASRGQRELQFQAITDVAQLDQLLGQLTWAQVPRRALTEGADRRQEVDERFVRGCSAS